MVYTYSNLFNGLLPKLTSLSIATHVQMAWDSGIQHQKMDTMPLLLSTYRQMLYFILNPCVLSALENVQSKAPKGSNFLIYTDNSNSVDIFHTLCCLPPYNPLLKAAVDILIHNDYSLRVLHIPGEENIIADALSRICFSIALNSEPNLKLDIFHPPVLERSSK